MASTSVVTFKDGTVSSSEQTTKKSLGTRSKNFVAVLIATNAAGPTIDVDIEHSPDGTNWFVLQSMTQVTGNTTEIQNITSSVLVNVRANITVTAGSADLRVQLWYDDDR